MKDPDTGKRQARLNPEAEWHRTEVPELRIIDDALWNRVKARQRELDALPLQKRTRPRSLLSGLLKCGKCGGGYGKVSKTHLGCSNARNKGTCDNRRTIKQADLEVTILEALEKHLMDPELVGVFCEEYTRHVNVLKAAHNTARQRLTREQASLTKERERLIQAIKDGVPGPLVKDDLIRVSGRLSELKTILSASADDAVRLHPNMAQRYREEVSSLREALNHPNHRTEAASLLRSLVDRVVLKPSGGKKPLKVDLQGDLAGILTAATGRQGRIPRTICYFSK